jgi:hypothetical protein
MAAVLILMGVAMLRAAPGLASGRPMEVFGATDASHSPINQSAEPQAPAYSSWADPGIYTFLDWRNVDPAEFPFVVGGHQVFVWNDIEDGIRSVYDWRVVDNWLNAQASLGKPTGIGFNSYDGLCCGGAWLPHWYVQQRPDGYVTCDGTVLPKYWSDSYKQAWSEFIQAAGARYGNDPRVKWVEISVGIFGETKPAEDQFDACLSSHGLTSDLWVETVNEIVDMYQAAWPSKPLFLQYVPFFTNRVERREFSDYAGSLGIGMKHNNLLVDHDDQVIDDPTHSAYRSGQYDPKLTFAGQVPMAWEVYRHEYPTETDTYWAILNGLDKHPAYLLVNYALMSTVTPLEAEMLHFANEYAGRTLQDTPSVWTALREPLSSWFPQRGNFNFWLYQNDAVPGGQTVPLWYVNSAPQGRYARRTDGATGNPYMYFDVDDAYMLGGSNVVSVTVTYLDQGTDTWRLEYDSVADPYAVGFEVQKQNTGQWLTVSRLLTDAHFANRQDGGPSQPGQDFRIYNADDGDDILHLVSVARLGGMEQISVTLQSDGINYDGTVDTYISNWSPETNYGNGDRMIVRSNDQMAPLLRFDLDDIPAGAPVSKAYLELFVRHRSNASNWLDAEVYAMQRNWIEDQATWNLATSSVPWSQPGANDITSDRSIVPLDSQRLDQELVWERFEVTEIVDEWVGGQVANEGLIVKSAASSGGIAYDFYTREASDIELRPRLVLTYGVPAPPPPTATPTPTPTASPTPTSSPTPTPTYTPSPTPTPVPPLEPARVITAAVAAAPLAIDGVLDDWTLDEGTLLDATTAELLWGEVPSASDLSARMWAAWDADALYLAVRVWDDVIWNEPADPVWQDDEIELGVDGAFDQVWWGPDDHQYTVNPDGRVTDGGLLGSSPNIERGVQVLADGWSVEVRIPASELGGAPMISDRWLGLTLGVHDDDDGGTWESYLIWEGQNTNGEPEAFGHLLLSGEGLPPCFFADVQPNSDHANRVACDGDVDIADVQRIAGCWEQAISAMCPETLDLDGSAAINLADVILGATQWGWRQP